MSKKKNSIPNAKNPNDFYSFQFNYEQYKYIGEALAKYEEHLYDIEEEDHLANSQRIFEELRKELGKYYE